jgi:hypothetical protein
MMCPLLDTTIMRMFIPLLRKTKWINRLNYKLLEVRKKDLRIIRHKI